VNAILTDESRKARAELLRGREVRRMPTAAMEVRQDTDTITFRGTASSTESPYDMGFYVETISRGAFSKTLSESPDVVLLINHEGMPLAATRNGSLRLEQSDAGLEFVATADAADPDAARVAAKVNSGLLNECSFAFRVTRQEWNEDYSERRIQEVSLDRGDVSIVTYGANPNTSVSLRAAFLDAVDLADDELDELRADPAVMSVIRRLSIETPEVVTPEVPATTVADLDTYLARAFVSRTRNTSRR